MATQLKARLDKVGLRVLCGTGCGTELAWVLEHGISDGSGKTECWRRAVWFVPGWNVQRVPAQDWLAAPPVWRLSNHALGRVRRGCAPAARRPADQSSGEDGPAGWLPWLPVDASCPSKGCGQRQTLDPGTLRVFNHSWPERLIRKGCVEPRCPGVAAGDSQYCSAHRASRPPFPPLGSPPAGDMRLLFQTEELQRWEEMLAGLRA